MRRIGLIAVLLSVPLACTDPVTNSDKSEETDQTGPTETDTDTPSETDTEPAGTDNDGDGVTVEEGDCDDDNLYATPGRDEDTNDDFDNDCDGRIDEKFDGLFTVLYNQKATDVSRAVVVDNLGTDTTETDMDDVYYSLFLGDDIDKIGFVGSDGGGVLTRYARDGTATTLLDLTDVEWDEDDEPEGAFGVAAHPDGYYLLVGGDRLWKVETDGSYEEVATWDCLEEDDSHTMYGYDVAVDWQTGEALIVGYVGGIATWSEEDGLTQVIAEDLENIVDYYLTVAYKDGGGFFVMGLSGDDEDYALYRYNASAAEMTLKGLWGRDATPLALAVEDNDAYVTATGGWHNYVYKWPLDGGVPEFLYDSGEADEQEDFSGVAVYYDVDGE